MSDTATKKGPTRARPKGKACMSRKPLVDSLGFWNHGLPWAERITRAEATANNNGRAYKPYGKKARRAA
jgi:hypothetical protein